MMESERPLGLAHHAVTQVGMERRAADVGMDQRGDPRGSSPHVGTDQRGDR